MRKWQLHIAGEQHRASRPVIFFSLFVILAGLRLFYHPRKSLRYRRLCEIMPPILLPRRFASRSLNVKSFDNHLFRNRQISRCVGDVYFALDAFIFSLLCLTLFSSLEIYSNRYPDVINFRVSCWWSRCNYRISQSCTTELPRGASVRSNFTTMPDRIQVLIQVLIPCHMLVNASDLHRDPQKLSRRKEG